MSFPGSIWLIIAVMFIFVVLVAAAVALGAWGLSRSGVLGGTAPERTVELAVERPDQALEIVRGRYARGEITRDEYESLRHDLDT
jgi:uncharacterized membrane protein